MVLGQGFDFISIEPIANTSFRALSVVDNRIIWASGSKGTVARSTDSGRTWEIIAVPGFESADFRSLYAFSVNVALIGNAGSPANILRTEDGGKSWKSVYTNTHKDSFFDGIDFWNNNDGLIYGDPIEGKMLLLRTSDGGKTWRDLSGSPTLEKGEASFAASGTGIRCTGKNDVIVCTGGIRSRLWKSSDKGESWKALNPPVAQGKPSTGIFSFAIRGNHLIVVGGDFQNDLLISGNHFYSLDLGQNWLAPKVPVRGYRECVEFLNEKTIISLGPSGVDISTDGGLVWSMFSDEKELHVIRKVQDGASMIAAGGGGKVVLIRIARSPK